MIKKYFFREIDAEDITIMASIVIVPAPPYLDCRDASNFITGLGNAEDFMYSTECRSQYVRFCTML